MPRGVGTLRPQHLAHSAIAAFSLVALIGVSIARLAGAPLWPVLAVASALWGIYAWGRLGATLAVAMTALGTMMLVLGTAFAAPLFGAPFQEFAAASWLAAGAVAVALLYFSTPLLTKFPATRFGVAAVSAWGAVLWLGTYAYCVIAPQATNLSWMMRNDTSPHFIDARIFAAQGGITLDGLKDDPVPLGHVLVAAILVPSDGVSGRAGALERDLGQFALVWVLLLALTCILAGSVAALLVGRIGAGARPATYVAAACGSALPLTWFFSGFPIEYGFFNAPVVFVVLLAAFVAFLHSERHPAVALAAQFLAATLIFAVWSPLVLVPAALAAVLVLRRRPWSEMSTSGRVLVSASLLQLVAYSAVIELPLFISSRSGLANSGAILGFPAWMLPMFGVGVLVLSQFAFGRSWPTARRGIVAAVVIGLVGLGVLLISSDSALGGAWSYYPQKYAWFVSALLIVVGVGLAGRTAARTTSRRLGLGALVAMSAVIALFLGPLTLIGHGKVAQVSTVPLAPMVAGTYYGTADEFAEAVIDGTRDNEFVMRWRSSDPNEHMVNFWLLQLAAEYVSPEARIDLITLANLMRSDGQVCSVATLVGVPTEVVTADPGLVDILAGLCPELPITVTMETSV